jgi:hypothetical protein
MSALRLWHYTCEHGHVALGARGTLLAPPYPAGGVADTYGEAFAWYDRADRPVWLTVGDFDTTGIRLTPGMCDRSEYRYLATAPWLAEPWLPSRCRAEAPPNLVRGLERSGDPAQWWIAQQPIPARLA